MCSNAGHNHSYGILKQPYYYLNVSYVTLVGCEGSTQWNGQLVFRTYMTMRKCQILAPDLEIFHPIWYITNKA